ncbi:MAG: response regulator [Treponema sp.]|jgi:signal transduction histidine kinase/DNA-binding response OmpR family regulator|nr:response regulator [Treponema sp.]
MRISAKLSKALFSEYTQMAMVVLAFIITGISSFVFVSNIEHKHLTKDAKDAITYTVSEISSNLMEPESFLSGYSETVRNMILHGDNQERILQYIQNITNYTLIDEDHMNGFISAYGYFEIFGGVHLSGIDWIPPDNFIIQERPWYIAAVNANGKVVTTEPYIDAMDKKIIITYSRRLLDNSGNPIGVFCLDISVDRILKNAINNMNLAKTGYCLILNKQLEIIAYNDESLKGKSLSHFNYNLAVLENELLHGIDISERRVKISSGEDTIVFFQKINYGWILGLIIPISEYYRTVTNMAFFHAFLSSLFASALCWMLHRISISKKKSDLKTQQKSRFLATISHEIRTPLNVILGITEIQLQNMAITEDVKAAFLKIYNSGDLLLSIINDILDLSKIEAGKLELLPEKYETASMINDIVQLNTVRNENKPIKFILNVNENIPSVLVGDELHIKQIINNILSNAFKYTGEGTVTLDVNAVCITRGGAVHVTLVFQVIDTGQGMTAEQIHNLFDEYTRFNLEANRTTEGTGLGMTITRNLIELMFGKITVKSTIDEGTTVTVRIPQKTDGFGIKGVIGREMAENLKNYQSGAIHAVKKKHINYEPMYYGNVLIVDDVETNIYVAKGLLSPYDLNIDSASSGFEAMDKLKEGKIYDIIFMDHMMPKMDGLETTKLIRKTGYNHPIIALTANALAGHAEMFLNNGFDGFISKPIDIRQLDIYLNKMIRDKQTSEVIEAAYRKREENNKRKAENKKTPEQIGRQLAEIFARDARKVVSVLETLKENGYKNNDNIQTYIINVHAIKSALANIGEHELSAFALSLEQAGRNNDLEIISAETPFFIDTLRKIIVKIESNENENSLDAKQAEDLSASGLSFLNEKLCIIIKACVVYDKKTVKNTMNEIREKVWSAQVKNILSEISEHILHSEFDEAAATAVKYLADTGKE